jgi:REP element-mobilizing transposase RayT
MEAARRDHGLALWAYVIMPEHVHVSLCPLEPKYELIEYIHDNPVRRGLVEKATDWVWSSARFYAGEINVSILMDPLPCLGS